MMDKLIKNALPPLLESIEDGKVKWKRMDNVDFESVGFFLTCHLIIEHYIDSFLVAYSPIPFDWSGAKLTFSQKISLISRVKQFREPYLIPEALKHFNTIRNKMSHGVRFTLSKDVLLPEIQFLKRVADSHNVEVLPMDTVKDVIDNFTMTVCVYLASAITYSTDRMAH